MMLLTHTCTACEVRGAGDTVQAMRQCVTASSYACVVVESRVLHAP